MAMDYQGAFVYGPDDMRTQTLEALGFRFPDSLRDAFPGEFGGQLSDERIDELDLDALVWIAEPKGAAKLKRGPVYVEARRAQGGSRRLHGRGAIRGTRRCRS